LKIGDLVRYTGYLKSEGPLAIVANQKYPDEDFHHRIRVFWLGENLPIQAKAFSVSGKRLSTWIHPREFSVVSKSCKPENSVV
jgi:hypothetical protein